MPAHAAGRSTCTSTPCNSAAASRSTGASRRGRRVRVGRCPGAWRRTRAESGLSRAGNGGRAARRAGSRATHRSWEACRRSGPSRRTRCARAGDGSRLLPAGAARARSSHGGTGRRAGRGSSMPSGSGRAALSTSETHLADHPRTGSRPRGSEPPRPRSHVRPPGRRDRDESGAPVWRSASHSCTSPNGRRTPERELKTSAAPHPPARAFLVHGDRTRDSKHNVRRDHF
jgi:hypothetical protein